MMLWESDKKITCEKELVNKFFKGPVLGRGDCFLDEERVDDGQRDHRFNNRHNTRTNARIVTAFDFDFGIFEFHGNRFLFLRNG